MLGNRGWMQRINLVVAGMLVVIAAAGMRRALRYVPCETHTSTAVAVFAAGMTASSIFVPDPANGFPPGSTEQATATGMLHLACGMVQFAAAVMAAALFSRWARRTGRQHAAHASRVAAIMTGAAFLGGASLTSTPVGTGLLWLAVITELTWLAAVSIYLWGIVPHPDRRRRATETVYSK